MKRKLTEEERRHTLRGIERLKRKNEILAPKLEYHKLLVSGLLEANFKEQMDDAKDKVKMINQDLENNNYSINEMKKHLTEGVEIKNPDKKEEKEEIKTDIEKNPYVG